MKRSGAGSRSFTSFSSPVPFRRRLRVPAGDGELLIDPSAEELIRIVDSAAQGEAQHTTTPLGEVHGELALAARSELLEAAKQYSAGFLDSAAVGRADRGPKRLILCGHQPGLHHPGVWLKSFVLDAIARRANATAVNLIIDGDVLRTATVIAPGGTPTDPRLEAIRFDGPHNESLWELRPIADRALFDSFAIRAANVVKELVAEPIVLEFWPLAQARAQAGVKLGEALSQARRQWEGRWGLDTLEVPQSRVCGLSAFRRWAAFVLSDLPRFVEAYNRALAEYRRAHRVRNAAQPLPDLLVEGDRFEAPFWLVPPSGGRRRLFARVSAAGVELSDDGGWSQRLPDPRGDAGREAGAILEQFESQGFRIRTRALTTTVWARLYLSDLFIHGIGGAAYDEVTDRIIADYYGIAPPRFAAVSGTLYLPVDAPQDTEQSLRENARLLRELEYHPDRFEPPCELAARKRWDELVEEKRRLVSEATPQLSPAERHRAIARVNRELLSFLVALRDHLIEQRAALHRAQRIEGMLRRRDWPWVFYPATKLREFFDGILHKID